ncbi:MAG: hypothetical protein J5826_04260 [Bacteroidales bacterium]|nr:hypothetical protein [Bacteroidales bacterium]MBP5367107.1 hypothetical protein [Bacteroidales bacterium]
MGAGYYSYDTAQMRRSAKYEKASMNEIFTQTTMDEKMNPKGAIRECCENEEHPDTLPIIIGLDVTGSMGHVPAHLIKNDFPEVMKKILEEGVPCPQLCFVAYGDHLCDEFPLQVGQFEASDELMEQWLTKIYLEGGGGGNGGESTTLVYYFAARHTSCDAITKRGKKGLLITIGDEPNHPNYAKKDMNDIFGGAEKDLTSGEIIDEARKNWDIYHINILDWVGSSAAVKNCWNELLGDHFISVDDNTDANISNMIAKLAVEHYKKYYKTQGQSATATNNAATDPVTSNAATDPADNYHPPMML